MADRSRSRSPDRGAPPADENHAPGGGDAGDPSGGGDGEEVKLYVGNLDYGTCQNERFTRFACRIGHKSSTLDKRSF